MRDGPCLELIIVSSNFQALLVLQDKLLESVLKAIISSKNVLKITGPALSRINSVIISARTVWWKISLLLFTCGSPRPVLGFSCYLQGGPGSVRFGYGLGMERFERFRFSVPAVPLRRGVLCASVQFSREAGSGFGSWKTVPTVPAVPVPRSVPGKTVPTVPVSGSGAVPGPPCICLWFPPPYVKRQTVSKKTSIASKEDASIWHQTEPQPTSMPSLAFSRVI